MVRKLMLMLLALAPISSVLAGDYQPVDSIKTAALGALGPGATGEVALDPALRMPRCDQPLQAAQSAAGTVEVGCPSGWRLYVPVKVRRMQTVLVLTRGVAAGETLSADAFATETRDAGRISGVAVADAAMAVGQVVRRMLPAGTVLGAGDLVSQRLVRRGDTVALIAYAGGLEVRMAGRALADGGQRDRVSVENLTSRKIVQGTVDAQGNVVVSR
ncbi:MAG: flagellar basal body P-ring formation chaperone FlgA [Pseudoxanthomonas sp.]